MVVQTEIKGKKLQYITNGHRFSTLSISQTDHNDVRDEGTACNLLDFLANFERFLQFDEQRVYFHTISMVENKEGVIVSVPVSTVSAPYDGDPEKDTWTMMVLNTYYDTIGNRVNNMTSSLITVNIARLAKNQASVVVKTGSRIADTISILVNYSTDKTRASSVKITIHSNLVEPDVMDRILSYVTNLLDWLDFGPTSIEAIYDNAKVIKQ